MDLVDAHAGALDVTGAFVAGVAPHRWDGTTPCDGWSVRELLNHVVTGNWWVHELVGGRTIAEVGDRYDRDVLGDDPLAAYDESARAAEAAFATPDAMDRPCAVSYGPVPGRIYCGHRLIDVLVHGWDLASATGQDATLPHDLVEACLAVVEPEHEALAASGAFGTEVAVPPDAGAQVRLLALLGRRG